VLTRTAVTLGLALLVLSGVSAQQNRLTDAQLKSAAAEVPRLVELLELKPGMTVADVGAGFGAWTMTFAKWIGPAGRVYANEIGESQLAALREAATREKLTNVTVVAGTTGTTNLPAGCCDAILIRDAYHHFTEPTAIIGSLAASLKPGGRLAVIDFAPRPGSQVPAGVLANRLGHGVPPEVVVSEVGAVLTHLKTIPAWAPDSQPAALYVVLFRKP